MRSTEHPATIIRRERLFTFGNVDRLTRIMANQDFYGRCWKCEHRVGHHFNGVWVSECRLCECYIGPNEPVRA